MSNFKKLADTMRFSPDKMKKNGVFETERADEGEEEEDDREDYRESEGN